MVWSYNSSAMQTIRPKEIFNKITIFVVGATLVSAILIIRLFQLQVLAHSHYQDIATREQYGFIEIPAQRGEIIIKDYHSDEEFSIATNTTLNLLYADPVLIKDPITISDKIAPLIFSIEEERAADEERRNEIAKNLAPELSQEEIDVLLRPLSDEELEIQFKQNFLTKISQKQRPKILLADDLEAEKLAEIKNLALPGIEVENEKVYAYPPQISQISFVAAALAPLVEIPTKNLEKILKGENRYVVLKRRLTSAVSDQIAEDMMPGLGLKEEYFRFYPEDSLAANIIGYVSRDNVGQYGIESAFNNQLQGVFGKLQTKRDSIGRQITVGESTLQAAVDGDDIVLTIDRSVQLEVEKILVEDAKAYRADSAQITIMNPQTGAIIAMAHYPTFDPNKYGDVFKKVEINLTPEEIAGLQSTKDEGIYYFYVNEVTLDRYPVFEQKDENGNVRYYRYENFRGPEVYHNKIVSWPYEPGSVFKPVVMSMAIDDGDVTPNTTFNDSGPVPVDFNVYSQKYDFEIKNSEGRYFGLTNMKVVIAQSLNTGMTFVAKKMGASLFYSYLKKYGFLDRTDIEFEGESAGKVEYFEDWTESELATHAFGQGLSITPLQLANAYSVLANGGVLMQPYIVEEIRHDDGTVTKTEPREIRQVISEDTSAKMTAMLVYSVENGVAIKAAVPGHSIAGKTGTSQTYKHGQALSGSGTTIASFAGYAPVDDPQFVIIVKFDHPRSSEWGNQTAAVTFSKIAGYLFDYYNVPPDKE